MAYKKFTASEDMLKPDPRFNSKLVSKFINCLMWDGKKTVAQKIFYDAMDIVTKKMKDVPPLEVFETAINNVKPYVEVRSQARRRGQLPGADAGEQAPPAEPGVPLDHRRLPRRRRPPDVRPPRRRADGRLPARKARR